MNYFTFYLLTILPPDLVYHINNYVNINNAAYKIFNNLYLYTNKIYHIDRLLYYLFQIDFTNATKNNEYLYEVVILHLNCILNKHYIITHNNDENFWYKILAILSYKLMRINDNILIAGIVNNKNKKYVNYKKMVSLWFLLVEKFNPYVGICSKKNKNLTHIDAITIKDYGKNIKKFKYFNNFIYPPIIYYKNSKTLRIDYYHAYYDLYEYYVNKYAQ